MPFLEGFLIGVSTILLLGPVFFTLLQIVLDYGKKAGFSVALGIITSDSVIIALFYIGAEAYFKDPLVQLWLAGIGSIVLFLLGFKYILKPYVVQQTKEHPTLLSISGYFIKGFLVNFVNPFVFFVWVSILTYANTSFVSTPEIGWYIFAVLLGIFATDTLKILLAGKLQTMLNPLFLKRLFKGIGIVLIVFGLRLVYFVVEHL